MPEIRNALDKHARGEWNTQLSTPAACEAIERNTKNLGMGREIFSAWTWYVGDYKAINRLAAENEFQISIWIMTGPENAKGHRTKTRIMMPYEIDLVR